MSLARKAVIGALWQVGGGLGARVIGLVGTLVLTRFLLPTELGEVGAASLLVIIVGLLTNAALGQYVVARQGLKPSDVAQATVVSVAMAVVGAALVIPLSGPLGPLFNAENMSRYVPGLALAMVIERIGEMPERVLTRDLRFRAIGIGMAFGELTYTGVTLLCAMNGLGGFSVVYGNIAQWTMRLCLFAAALPASEWLAFRGLEAERVRDMFRFGAPLAIANFAHQTATKGHKLLISAFHGKAGLGIYNMAYNLAEVPSQQIGDHILDVLMPSFAKLDLEERKRALLRSIGLLSLIVFPLALGLGAVAETLVAVAFNAEWQGIAPLLVFLCGLSLFHPVPNVIFVYVKASDRTPDARFLQVTYLIALLLLLCTVGRISLAAAAIAASLAAGIRLIAGASIVIRKDGLSTARLAQVTLPSLAASFVMVAAVYGARWLLAWSPSAVRLLVEIAVGAVVYVATALLIARPVAKDFFKLIRKVRERDV